MNVLLFLAVVFSALFVGAYWGARIGRVNQQLDATLAAHRRGQAICDESENGWAR